MSPPRVSVLLAVKDGTPWLREAVQGVLAQTFEDLEIVVIDDGSSDGTPEVLAGLAAGDRRVRVLRWRNQGLTAALNRGLLECRGALVARQDADDRSHPERITRQVAFLDRHPEVVLLGTGARLLGEGREVYATRAPPESDEAVVAALRRRNIFFHTSAMFRRSAVAKVGGYDPRFRRAQDYDLWLRLLDLGEGANLGEALVDLYQGSGRISREAARVQAWAALLAKLKNRRGRVLRGASRRELLQGVRGLVIPPGTWHGFKMRWLR